MHGLGTLEGVVIRVRARRNSRHRHSCGVRVGTSGDLVPRILQAALWVGQGGVRRLIHRQGGLGSGLACTQPSRVRGAGRGSAPRRSAYVEALCCSHLVGRGNNLKGRPGATRAVIHECLLHRWIVQGARRRLDALGGHRQQLTLAPPGASVGLKRRPSLSHGATEGEGRKRGACTPNGRGGAMGKPGGGGDARRESGQRDAGSRRAAAYRGPHAGKSRSGEKEGDGQAGEGGNPGKRPRERRVAEGPRTRGPALHGFAS